MKIGSNITWFDEDDYIRAAVSFPAGSVWRLETKVREHEYYETKVDIGELGIRIPWVGTATKRSSVRAQQATLGPAPNFQTEIDALFSLTKAHSSSTPSLFDWKKEKQSEDGWVP
ncbi:uncharacterized protein KD926_005949 [Aspergillus affinis]|uniref:uncharacterized protein n=1 Tax=Aspergillus affinis TaxID=1070780 RepID=UPI0022FEB9DF|nr:uncharacterized protein KD926_005949 [Aspergillus affinis]KAI9046003.1 hypothetical protein KD926_005949 [Aspergillus affinis]